MWFFIVTAVQQFVLRERQTTNSNNNNSFLKRIQVSEKTDAIVIFHKDTKLQCKHTFSLSLIFLLQTQYCQLSVFRFFLIFYLQWNYIGFLFQQSATPITWIGYKGKEVSMETIHIQRAKELKELYYIMSEDSVTAKERMEMLSSLKFAVGT